MQIEAPLVQWALDLMTFHKPLAQARMAMGAKIVDGVDLIADSKEREVTPGHSDAEPCAIPQRAEFGGKRPLLTGRGHMG